MRTPDSATGRSTQKLPEGIDYIASHAHRKGLKFGIWIEPEMVNPKSELAEKHPDWIVRSGDREMPRMRNQWLLDLTNPKVQDFIFSVFDNTMKLSPNIDYIKWDANRHAENAGSEFLPKDRQSHFWIDYVQGFYKVMERIRAKYPDVLIQACASGGGRVEYGAMKYFNEVWTSDNTEALSRARISTAPACSTRRRSWARTSRPRPTTRPATSRRSNSASTWPARAVWAWSCSPSR